MEQAPAIGIDFFDLVYRLERRFGVRLRRSDFRVFWGQGDVTVGGLHEWVGRKAPMGLPCRSPLLDIEPALSKLDGTQ